MNSTSIFMSNPQLQQLQQQQKQPLVPQNVLQLYQKLHKNIDEMQKKVQNVIVKHQSEFLMAYRTHITKIKKQLGEIKKRSEEQEKMFSANDRIKFLEKEISVFRDEAIRVYEKLEKTTTQLELYRRKYDDVYKMYQLTQRDLKQTIKQSKGLNISQTLHNQKIQTLQNQLTQKQQQLQKLHQQQLHQDHQFHQQQLPNSQKQSSRKNLLASIGSDRSQNRYEKYQKLDNSRGSTHLKSVFGESTVLDQANFRDIFFTCVRSVKREIGFRKHVDKMDMGVLDVNQFREMDKIRVMQKFFSDPKLQKFLYQKLFPNTFIQKLDAKKELEPKTKPLFQLTTTGFILPKVKQNERKHNSKLENKNRSFI